MLTFLFAIALFFMMIAGLFSLLFASRSFIFILWNFLWYYVMGLVAVRVFGPQGGTLPLIFGALYLWRILVARPSPHPKIIFKNFQSGGFSRGPTNASRDEAPSEKLARQPGDVEVIDVEFTKAP